MLWFVLSVVLSDCDVSNVCELEDCHHYFAFLVQGKGMMPYNLHGEYLSFASHRNYLSIVICFKVFVSYYGINMHRCSIFVTLIVLKLFRFIFHHSECFCYFCPSDIVCRLSLSFICQLFFVFA